MDMRGKVALVTGANNGIGKETALGLARLGATVICVCRDRARGEAAVEAIRAATGNVAVELRLCDLSSQKSIRDFAIELRRHHTRVHVLVNNAGVINPDRQTTVDGHELTFGLNHLGYFLLTTELLDLLEASAPARIVNVSSHAQRLAGKMNFDDLMAERGYKAMRAYGQSKLANVLFTYELARRLAGKGVTVNAVHPGAVASGFGAQFRGIAGMAVKAFRRFMRSPEKGAETVVWAASSPDVEGVTGRYFYDKKEVQSVPSTYDPAQQKRLWEVSERLVGAAPG